jgi:hypothetical protein
LQRRIKARAFDFVVNLNSDIQTTSIVAQITPSNVQITLEVSYAGNKQLKTTENQIQKEKGGGNITRPLIYKRVGLNVAGKMTRHRAAAAAAALYLIIITPTRRNVLLYQQLRGNKRCELITGHR